MKTKSTKKPQNTAVLLDIDKLVKTSAAAAFLQNKKEAFRPKKPNNGATLLNMSQNNIFEGFQPPIIGKKKLTTFFNPNATAKSSQLDS